jgi:hypothetical protein
MFSCTRRSYTQKLWTAQTGQRSSVRPLRRLTAIKIRAGTEEHNFLQNPALPELHCTWDLRSSGMLRGVVWYFLTTLRDIVLQHIGIYSDRVLQGLVCLHISTAHWCLSWVFVMHFRSSAQILRDNVSLILKNANVGNSKLTYIICTNGFGKQHASIGPLISWRLLQGSVVHCA